MANGSNLITALRPVRPGDLITATFFNDLISAIWELEERVSVLEAEGRLVVPEDGGEPVRRVAIKAAIATRTNTALSFKVFGSGLAPDGLKSFSLNGIPFEPKRLEGDDSLITFLADRDRLRFVDAVSDVTSFVTERETATSRSGSTSGAAGRAASTLGGSGMFLSRATAVGASAAFADRIGDFATVVEPVRQLVLTIEAKSGSIASRAVQMA